MTHFGPTKAEHIFRLSVSIIGLTLICAAVFWRGVPVDAQSLVLLVAFSVFLGISAALGFAGLNHLDED